MADLVVPRMHPVRHAPAQLVALSPGGLEWHLEEELGRGGKGFGEVDGEVGAILEVAVGQQLLQRLLPADHHCRAHQVDLGIDLGGGGKRVVLGDRHPEELRRVEGDVVLGAVGQNHRDDVALAHAAHGQHLGGAAYLVEDLRVAELPGEEVNRDPVGEVPRGVDE